MADLVNGCLATESINPGTDDIDNLSPLGIVQRLNAEDAKVAAAVERELPRIADAIDQIATRLRRGGRLIYVGAGTSGRLGVLDASECPPTFNTPSSLVVGCIAGGREALTRAVEDIEDDATAGRSDLERLGLTERDTVVGVAASGRTPYVLGAVAFANDVGALTVGLACNRPSPLAERVSIMITPLVGPEAIAGSTRLKSGTAQKMVLNMLSTGTMILLGKTYGNLMVDLRAANDKLRKRAVRIVQVAAGIDAASAAELLKNADGETKTAIVMGRTKLDASTARARLAAANGSVRAALAETSIWPG